MGVRFETPEWLLIALLALPMGLLAWRSFSAMTRWRRASAVAARAVLLVLLAMALAGASAVRETQRVSVLAVVDRSDSVRAYAEPELLATTGAESLDRLVSSFLRAAAEDRGPDDTVGVVAFDGSVVAVSAPSRSVGVLDRDIEAAGIEGSDLESAVRRAAAMIPADASGRIVLFSDGNETAGDVAAAVRELVRTSGDATGLRVDVVELGYELTSEVAVEAVDVPPRAPAESAVTVRVTLRSAGRSAGTLRLLRDGEPVDLNGDAAGTGRAVELAPGRTVELVEVPLGAQRLHRFDAIFEPDVTAAGSPIGDVSLANNRASSFTLSPSGGSVLLVDGVSGGTPGSPGTQLARTLEGAGIAVTPISSAAMPEDLLELEQYDLVVLQDVPASDVDESVQASLAAYVRELGGGLVMVGGPNSFGAGGWRGSTLEPILPVALDLPERLRIPEAAIVLVLDSSGSMSQSVLGSSRTQQDIANEAAARALRSLEDRDLVGVIEFSGTASVVQPLEPNTDPERTAERIRSITSGGGTSIGPGLELAYEQLSAAEAQVKHVIVLTDGRSENAEVLPQIAQRMRAAGIYVSTIGVGDGADLESLKAIASAGSGAHYTVVNPNVLPRVFLKAVQIERTPRVREQAFEPVVPPTGSPLTAGLGPTPPLGGLTLTRVREEPTITQAMLSPQGEPVLAHWSVGLGQVAAFTSDAHDWGEAWNDDGIGARFWAQLARSMARVRTDDGGELRAESVGESIRVVYDAWDEDGRPLDLLTVPVVAYGPGGQAQEATLRQSGPGRYEGEVASMGTGSHVVVATPRLGSARRSPVLAGATVVGGVEYRALRSGRTKLEAIAEAGGGELLDLASAAEIGLFDRAAVAPRLTMTPLWPVLLAWALVVFLLDVATRRIAWDRFFGEEFGAVWRDLGSEAARSSVGQLAGLRARPAAAGGVVGPAPLSEVDAARLARQQKERRRESEAERLREIRAELLSETKPASPTRGGQAEPPKPKADETPDSGQQGASGLLAAKRRARERYGSEDEA